MELLSPAGSVQKLYYAFCYGADAAYIGIRNFSLRLNAENLCQNEYEIVQKLKKDFPEKKIYCTLNKLFRNKDIDDFVSSIDYFKQYPIDAFIVQDLGLVPILQKHFPKVKLHLSTQASCLNKEAAKFYSSLGFSRIVLAREASLEDIRKIKDAVPQTEIEVFCHGAMCIAYSGRCLMSAYLSGRSGQNGDCSHSCRWDFDVLAKSGNIALEEHKRRGEYLPIYEGDDFSAVLSSKDLCMIDHLFDLKKAGVDALKIEGRMKSIYYVSLVTQAYKKSLEALEGKITQQQAQPFIDELKNVSSRQSTTGFYYDAKQANETTKGQTSSPYTLVASVQKLFSKKDEEDLFEKASCAQEKQEKQFACMHPKKQLKMKDAMLFFAKQKENRKMFSIQALNMIEKGDTIEVISPGFFPFVLCPDDYDMIDPRDGSLVDWTCDGHPCVIYAKNCNIQESSLLRKKTT